MSCDLDPKAPVVAPVVPGSPGSVVAANVMPAPPPASSSNGATPLAPTLAADDVEQPGPATTATSLRPTTVCGFLEG